MTDLDQLLAHITAVLDECDAARLPPVVKLTRDQIDSIPAAPPPLPWANGSLGIPEMLGIPVQIVDTVEESTPYQLRHGPVLHVADDGPRLIECEDQALVEASRTRRSRLVNWLRRHREP